MTALYISTTNRARITITSIGNRNLIDFGWQNRPPSAEDQAAAEEFAIGTLREALGVAVTVVEPSTVYVEGEREKMLRKQREFFGGGQG